MARISKSERMVQIADAALKAFSEKGFRRTQVADVAAMAGVAPGTIYLFAANKEALFWLALSRALGDDLDAALCEPPQPEELGQRFAPNGACASLTAYFQNGTSLPLLSTVLEELWETLDRSGKAIYLIERCAQDWPELAAQFYEVLRPRLLKELSTYLSDAASAGVCRPMPDPNIAGRIILETSAWFAMHRMGDFDGRHYTVAASKSATIDALLHAYQAPIASETI